MSGRYCGKPGYILFRCAHLEDAGKLDEAIKLLKVAKCPNCDGSGSIPRQVASQQVVTKEMALDAGDPSLAGSCFGCDEWEQEQCQWCDERTKLLEGLC